MGCVSASALKAGQTPGYQMPAVPKNKLRNAVNKIPEKFENQGLCDWLRSREYIGDYFEMDWPGMVIAFIGLIVGLVTLGIVESGSGNQDTGGRVAYVILVTLGGLPWLTWLWCDVIWKT